MITADNLWRDTFGVLKLRTDHGEVIPAQKRPQDGRFAPGRPRPDDRWEQIERRFIHPDQRPLLPLRLFFSPPASARCTRR